MSTRASSSAHAVRMLAISPPCLVAVNRAIYRFLASEHGFAMNLVFPRSRMMGSDFQTCESSEGESVETTPLEMTGRHPRVWRLLGLERLLESWRPTHILIDSDPASMLVRQAVQSGSRLNSARPKIWALTAENQMPDTFRDLSTGVRHLKPHLIAGPLVTWWLRNSVKTGVDRVLTISRDGTRVMEALGFRSRVTQIPLGFDRRLFYPYPPDAIASTRARLGLTLPTIAYFGRLSPEKGLHILLPALASIKDLPWRFLIDRFSAYDSPYTARVQEQIASMGLTERVVFFDAGHAEMPEYMNAADFVVLPSISTPKWKEQYGRVIPEAMACGKIVIGSSSGAIPEIIGEAGYIFPEGDSGALGELLRMLLTQEPASFKPMREAAFRRSHSYYSVDRQAAILAELAQYGSC
ncbi:MAG: glycosyltransferase [Acidobacteriia bacterium]|nr:glycosyltransferase [Terriglobia bacterium]MBV8902446.1 glycosyltransferase [Terriglobia bacterium]MBV9743831.1 glycosyltransferase [Terriglobia bacterium]